MHTDSGIWSLRILTQGNIAIIDRLISALLIMKCQTVIDVLRSKKNQEKSVLITILEKDIEAVDGFNSVSLVQVRTVGRSSLHVPLQTDWRCRTRTGLPIPWLH